MIALYLRILFIEGFLLLLVLVERLKCFGVSVRFTRPKS